MITPDMPIRIGKQIIKNRITMAPTVKFTAGDDGKVTDFFVKHYSLRVQHGCGLICVEATAVSPEGRLAPTQIYACSPEDSSFTAIFSNMQLTECAWKAHDGQQPD